MFLLNLPVKVLTITLFLSNIRAVPPPLPEQTSTLKYAPLLNDDGLKHAWQGWEPIDLDSSKLEDYVKEQHDEMHEQSWKGDFKEIDMPCCIASLHIPKEGVYSVSDYGQQPLATPPQLHPQTSTILNDNALRLGTLAGSCAEIKALDAYHRRFPDKPIPPGSCIAIWGRRNLCQAPKLLKTCSQHCKKILQAKGIKCQDQTKKVTGKPRSPNVSSSQRVQVSQGSGGMSSAAASPSMKSVSWSAKSGYWPNPESPRTGQKHGRISNIYKADANAEPPEQDPGAAQPKRGKKRKDLTESNGVKKNKFASGIAAGTISSFKTIVGATRSPVGPGSDSKTSQKHRSLNEIYKADDVAKILHEDLPQIQNMGQG
ncbi:hypothetical protein MMC30_004091 [Trapelia coarctata]|nr:hypothetical protein [Trapelia coarctata]